MLKVVVAVVVAVQLVPVVGVVSLIEIVVVVEMVLVDPGRMVVEEVAMIVVVGTVVLNIVESL